MASDEVIDGIAAIEMHRQGTEKESGLAAACSEALRKLHAMLEQEKEEIQKMNCIEKAYIVSSFLFSLSHGTKRTSGTEHHPSQSTF